MVVHNIHEKKNNEQIVAKQTMSTKYVFVNTIIQ